MNSRLSGLAALIAAVFTLGVERASAKPPEYSCDAQVSLGSTEVSAGQWFTSTGKRIPPEYRWYTPLSWSLFQSREARPGLDWVRVEFAPPPPGSPRAPPTDLGISYSYGETEDVWLVARMGGALWRQRFQRGRLIYLQLRGPIFDNAFARGDALEIYLQRADGSVIDSHREPMAEREEAASLAAKLWSDVEARAAQFQTQCRKSVEIE